MSATDELETLLAGLSTNPPLIDKQSAPQVAKAPVEVTPPWEPTATPEPTAAAPVVGAIVQLSNVPAAPSVNIPETISVTSPQPQPEPEREQPNYGLRSFIDPEQLRKDIAIDLADLDNAVRTHSANLVYYSELAARARHQFEGAKNGLEVTLAQLYKLHRDALVADATKKATEAQIDAAVKMDPRWIAAQDKVSEARLIMDLCAAAREGFQQRRDMLVQVSVDRRTEAQGELRINAAQKAAGGARGAAFTAMTGLSSSHVSQP